MGTGAYYPKDEEKLPKRVRYALMGENLIRKDLEIFRLQFALEDVAGPFEIFSQKDDELSSIEYVLALAFEDATFRIDKNITSLVKEAALQIAFLIPSLGMPRPQTQEFIDGAADSLNRMIFASSKEPSREAFGIKLIECFKSFLDELDVPKTATN